jgi:uncharacterized protein (UPF0332 family)
VIAVWDEYVLLAGDLARSDSEAWLRSAVSRAYYGAFNSARRWVEANLGPIENRAAHGQVWRAFKDSDRASDGTRDIWQVIGELGNELRVLRNQADYDDGMFGLDRNAPEAVVRAKQILALLPELKLAD